ncbi:MAG: type VI secretion system contractile sheath small subunit [Gammaproteobacteria bacterium]|nr:MAG: type VI secretion system contractile sheath small subunit [Gammaproteobacteria bacterium]
MAESIHNKLKRVRKPRVHITYDVETDGAVEKKEIPFVMGVMGDYTGDNKDTKKSLRERSFTQIDRDNFNTIMSKMSPQLKLKVENTLEKDGAEFPVNLEFNSMEDFEPQNIVNKVDPLKKLMQTRNKLRDLLTKADRSEDLEAILEQILSNADSLNDFSNQFEKDDSPEEKKGDE